MPEGDTIAWAANRIRPVLEGVVPDAIETPQPRHALDRWPQRLEGRAVTEVSTHGKHLFLHFDGGLVLHSHLGMTGAWGVYAPGRRGRRSRSRAWIVLRSRGHEVIEFDGPLLELITAGRVRFDQRLAALGPDVLAEDFDVATLPGAAALRRPDPPDRRRPARPAKRRGHRQHLEGRGLLGGRRRSLAARVGDFRRRGGGDRRGDASADGAVGREGPRTIGPRVYGMSGRPCPRCGTKIVARGQGDANRTTYWCPGCQR